MASVTDAMLGCDRYFEEFVIAGYWQWRDDRGVHVRILSDFVPEYIRYELLSKYYTRGQRQNESFLNFVEVISLMSEVFRLGVSEKEVVTVILVGTRAEVRALLV